MAIKQWDGFDHYKDSTDLFERADFIQYQDLDGLSSISFVTGLDGDGKALQIVTDDTGGDPGFGALFGQSVASAFIGLATNVPDGQGFLLRLVDSGSGTVQVSFYFNPSANTVDAYRGDFAAGSGTYLGSSVGHVWKNGERQYIEVFSRIDDTLGFVAVYVDSTNVMYTVNLDTYEGGNASFDMLYASSYGAGLTAKIDDLYYGDTVKSRGFLAGNTPIGDVSVVTLFAIANNVVDWAPLAHTNFEEINEHAMDSNTSYNHSNTLNQQDTFNYGLLPSSAQVIYGVQVTGAYKGENAVTATSWMEQLIVSGLTSSYGESFQVINDNYQYFADVYLLDPHTLNNWKPTAVNSMLAGYYFQENGLDTIGVIDSDDGSVTSGDVLKLNADLTVGYRITEDSIRVFNAYNGDLYREISGVVNIFGDPDLAIEVHGLGSETQWCYVYPDDFSEDGYLYGFSGLSSASFLSVYTSIIDANSLTALGTDRGLNHPFQVFAIPYYQEDQDYVKHYNQLVLVAQQLDSSKFTQVSIVNITHRNPYGLRGNSPAWSSTFFYGKGFTVGNPTPSYPPLYIPGATFTAKLTNINHVVSNHTYWDGPGYEIDPGLQTWFNGHTYSVGDYVVAQDIVLGVGTYVAYVCVRNKNLNNDPFKDVSAQWWFRDPSVIPLDFPDLPAPRFQVLWQDIVPDDYTTRGVNGWQENGYSTWFTWGFDDSVNRDASRCRILKWELTWEFQAVPISYAALISLSPANVDVSWTGIEDVRVTLDMTLDPVTLEPAKMLMVFVRKPSVFVWRIMRINAVTGAIIYNVAFPTATVDTSALPTMDAGPWTKNRWGYIDENTMYLLNLKTGVWTVNPNMTPGSNVFPGFTILGSQQWFDDVAPSIINQARWHAPTTPVYYLHGWAYDNAGAWDQNFNRIWLGPIVDLPKTVYPTTTDTTVRASQLVVEALIANLHQEDIVLPIYPTLPGLTYNVKWTPLFFNMPTATSSSGADIDLSLAAAPLHDFELIYEFLRDSFGKTEFKTMMGFFLRLGGTLGRFLFLNPDDNYVYNEFIASTNGSDVYYGPITRTFGAGDNVGTEPVGYIDLTQTANVYLDGVLQDSAIYTLDQSLPGNQRIRFDTAPTAGQTITMDLGYFYYCKFADPSLVFEKFMDRLWLLNQVKIHTCRAGA